MPSNLPRELLQQIFTDPGITKRDLLQLQLTNKHWSSIAGKYVYEEIDFGDRGLYTKTMYYDPNRLKDGVRRLTQTLLYSKIQARKWVKSIHLHTLFETRTPEWRKEVVPSVTALASLCPNITSLTGEDFPSHLFDGLSNLYLNGYIQELEYVSAPYYIYEEETTFAQSYNTAANLLKDKLQVLTIINGVGRAETTSNTITPDDLKNFPRLQELHLKDSSRLPLFQMRHYITQCSRSTASINIENDPSLYDTTRTPLTADYNVHSAITPKIQVRQLSLSLFTRLTQNEMLFIMHMFPSLDHFFFELVDDGEDDDEPIQRLDPGVSAQFLKYLILIPKVQSEEMYFSVSEGLGILPQLVDSTVQHLSIVSREREEDIDTMTMKASCNVGRKEAATIAKLSCLTIHVDSPDARGNLGRVLEALSRNKHIKSLRVGFTCLNSVWPLQKVNEHSIDYIVDKYTNLQELKYSYVEFPPGPPSLESPRVKHLHCLDLFYCKITEDYFTKLSCQIESVDYFKFSTSKEHETTYSENNEKDKIRIFLPHTTIKIMELHIDGWSSCTIKIWYNYKCLVTNLSPPASDIKGTTGNCEVTIFCTSLKQTYIQFNKSIRLR